MSSELFLHHYDASPFSQKAIKMLAIKGVRWNSVIHPMIAPKPELTALTGGYRGTPVLQIGADIYVDSQRIVEELERRLPTPTLYPGGRGAAHMMCEFGDAYFRAGLDIAIKEFSAAWDPAFYADRDKVFPDIDFSSAGARFSDACARLRSAARFIDLQLSDGRAFLFGDAPGLADIQCYVVNWFTRAGFPFVEKLLSDFSALAPWEQRMAALGEGDRCEVDASMAHEVARSSASATCSEVDLDDPLGLNPGDNVLVMPLTSSRGEAQGELVRLAADEVAIRPQAALIDHVVVHYPRLGYFVGRAKTN